MDNIAILHNILTSFLPILARSLNRRHALRPITQVMEVLVSYNLGFDEATFKISVDCSCCLRGKTALRDGPAANFFLAS
jgi:hypothetical protein